MVEWIILAKVVGSVLAGAAAGATVAVFWDEIKAWASRALGYILDAINWALEVTSDAITSLMRRGTRYYVRTEVYARNISSGNYRNVYKEKEVPGVDVPDEFKQQIKNKTDGKLRMMQRRT